MRVSFRIGFRGMDMIEMIILEIEVGNEASRSSLKATPRETHWDRDNDGA